MKAKIHFLPYLISLSVLLFVTASAYIYPRFLTQILGENNPWLSYLYTYGMGFLVFSFSIIWIFTRKTAPDLKKEKLFWLWAVCIGFIAMFLFHGLWIYAAINFPTKM